MGTIFYILGYAGNLLSPVEGSVGLLWPPTGFALGALLVFGARLWPGVVLGGLAVNLLVWGRPLPVAVAVAAAATLGVLCGYLLLRRAGFRTQLDRMRDLVALVVFGAVAGMTIVSTTRVGVLTLAGLVPTDDFWSRWWLDALSSIMGVIVVTPAVLLVPRLRLPASPRPGRAVEAVALLATAFAVMFAATRADVEVLFLIFPVLIWAALRFQVKGVAPCVLLASLMAVYGAAVGSGPFANQDLVSKELTILAFEAATALTSLVLAIATIERTRARNNLEHTADQLASAVAQLSGRLGQRIAIPAARAEWAHGASTERRVVRESIPSLRER